MKYHFPRARAFIRIEGASEIPRYITFSTKYRATRLLQWVQKILRYLLLVPTLIGDYGSWLVGGGQSCAGTPSDKGSHYSTPPRVFPFPRVEMQIIVVQ